MSCALTLLLPRLRDPVSFVPSAELSPVLRALSLLPLRECTLIVGTPSDAVLDMSVIDLWSSEARGAIENVGLNDRSRI